MFARREQVGYGTEDDGRAIYGRWFRVCVVGFFTRLRGWIFWHAENNMGLESVRKNFSRPSGTGWGLSIIPGAEAPGYCQTPLRDFHRDCSVPPVRWKISSHGSLKPTSKHPYATLKGPLFHGEARVREVFRSL